MSDSQQPRRPTPEPAAEAVADELLWSWVDRGAPELEAHLRQHPGDRERVARFREQIAGVARIGGAAARLPEWIGSYRVTGFLGAGAMGVVYAARQQRPDREVAIKVLRTWGLSDPRQVARFEREAAALGRLTHPAIATIHEAGVTDDDIPFLVMERVDGTGLLDHATRAGLDRQQRLELIMAVCEGVQAAHDGDVVHRDLKPGNILVDGNGRPRIVDFGLAQLADGDGEGQGSFAASHTATGMAGTLPYMSPEQLDDRGTVDAQSDVYALGVILFELLLGRLPHALAGLPLTAVVRRVCDEAPPRPRELDPSIPADLERVLLKAMSADKTHRYASAREFAADVGRHLAGELVLASTQGLVVRVRRWARRRRGGLVLAVAVALAGLAIAGWMRNGAVEEGPPTLRQYRGISTPERALFASARWRRDAMDVRHDGAWWELVAAGGVPVAAILGAASRRDAENPRAVVTRDLVGILAELAPDVPVDSVPLDLVPVGRLGAAVRLERRATREAWVALQDGGVQVMSLPVRDRMDRPTARTAAFDGCRWLDDGTPAGAAEVRVDGVWFGLESVAGLSVAAVRDRAFAENAVDDTASWRKRFAEDMAWLMNRVGVPVDEVVVVELRDLASGALLPARELTLTQEKRRQLMDADEEDGE